MRQKSWTVSGRVRGVRGRLNKEKTFTSRVDVRTTSVRVDLVRSYSSITVEATSRRAGARRMVVRQACEEFSGIAAPLREMRVHEQFRAKLAHWRWAASALGVRDEAAVRTQYLTLLSWLHVYGQLTASEKISSQVKFGTENVHLLNVVLTNVFSRIPKRFAPICRTSGGTSNVLRVKERWPGALDNIAMSPSNAYWGTGRGKASGWR